MNDMVDVRNPFFMQVGFRKEKMKNEKRFGVVSPIQIFFLRIDITGVGVGDGIGSFSDE